MAAVAGQRVVAIPGPFLVLVIHPQPVVFVADQAGERLEVASLVTRRAGRSMRSRRDRESMVERALIPRRVRGAVTAVAGGRETRRRVVRCASFAGRAGDGSRRSRAASRDTVVRVAAGAGGLRVTADEREHRGVVESGARPARRIGGRWQLSHVVGKPAAAWFGVVVRSYCAAMTADAVTRRAAVDVVHVATRAGRLRVAADEREHR